MDVTVGGIEMETKLFDLKEYVPRVVRRLHPAKLTDVRVPDSKALVATLVKLVAIVIPPLAQDVEGFVRSTQL